MVKNAKLNTRWSDTQAQYHHFIEGYNNNQTPVLHSYIRMVVEGEEALIW